MLRGFSCAATGRRFLPCPYLCSLPLTLPLDQAGLDWVCRPSAESVHNSVCLLAGLSAWSRLLPEKSGLGFVTFCAVPSTSERNCMPGARRDGYARHAQD
ncbi:hypothetical protein BGZ61DRAFT_443053 [Ilyonectria robusta]|uniref:uncharacterized protein n=1 Tax=Ilyonectria robusta TaxID=1079257 RepID=UPI001E8D2930|nr:uncharacterized protein BGZ61DRAFT_443053 [Ilyonectria robusta]KAH8734746.1 hypothetical protein BGZ61DRAFT_443053 [Ilyonectria robusta]